jgi:hypothetical protein
MLNKSDQEEFEAIKDNWKLYKSARAVNAIFKSTDYRHVTVLEREEYIEILLRILQTEMNNRAGNYVE